MKSDLQLCFWQSCCWRRACRRIKPLHHINQQENRQHSSFTWTKSSVCPLFIWRLGWLLRRCVDVYHGLRAADIQASLAPCFSWADNNRLEKWVMVYSTVHRQRGRVLLLQGWVGSTNWGIPLWVQSCRSCALVWKGTEDCTAIGCYFSFCRNCLLNTCLTVIVAEHLPLLFLCDHMLQISTHRQALSSW